MDGDDESDEADEEGDVDMEAPSLDDADEDTVSPPLLHDLLVLTDSPTTTLISRLSPVHLNTMVKSGMLMMKIRTRSSDRLSRVC
jgi:hypothetical protein